MLVGSNSNFRGLGWHKGHIVEKKKGAGQHKRARREISILFEHEEWRKGRVLDGGPCGKKIFCRILKLKDISFKICVCLKKFDQNFL
jgi:hypothetical protein